MSKLYYVRHGQTYWNVENKICGATDSPLTELGHQQAMETGELIKARGYKIDKIICSPLSRAHDTANHIGEILGLPVEIDERLTEQRFGRFEGTPRDGEEFTKSKGQFADSYEGGESMLRLAQRIYNVLDDCKADGENTYLLVAHNGIARCVNSYFYDSTNEEYASFGIKNCEVVEYEF